MKPDVVKKEPKHIKSQPKQVIHLDVELGLQILVEIRHHSTF